MDTITKLNLGFVMTVLGMGIVFSVLIFLSMVLKSLEIMFSEKKKKKTEEVVVKDESAPAPSAGSTDSSELIAVITAAVMGMLGGKKELVVRSIARVPDATPNWGKAGRSDQMASRL